MLLEPVLAYNGDSQRAQLEAALGPSVNTAELCRFKVSSEESAIATRAHLRP